MLAGLVLGLLLLVPSAFPRPAGAVAVPPKSFNLWQGSWRTPYGTLALRPASAVTVDGSGPRPGVRGTFSRGGTLVAYLSAPGDTPGNLGLHNVEIIGTYSIPGVGSGRFAGQTRWGEQDPQAYRAFEFVGRVGSPVRFRATFAGGGPTTSDLKRSFKVFGPEDASAGSVRRYRVRWVYEAALLGPRALPYSGLVLKFRFSKAIRPNHYAAQGPNLSTNAPRNVQTVCTDVLNKARNAVLGFDCNTYSLGVRGDGGIGWNVRASFEAILDAGSGKISASISNTIPDRFARVPAADLRPLRAGKAIPKAATTTTTTFAITSASLPSMVRANGPRGDLTVRWSGNPAFPVRMVYGPDSCPPGLNCSTPVATFSQPANPLVFRGAIWCAGTFRTSIFFDYSVYLQDARGVRTAKRNADFTCLPG